MLSRPISNIAIVIPFVLSRTYQRYCCMYYKITSYYYSLYTVIIESTTTTTQQQKTTKITLPAVDCAGAYRSCGSASLQGFIATRRFYCGNKSKMSVHSRTVRTARAASDPYLWGGEGATEQTFVMIKPDAVGTLG